VLTKILKDAGAVLYVKTNVPQGIMADETESKILLAVFIHSLL
jgi:Asp-tRNA(Asn)/Glu-tRNA(Gln) amidotransferase A subunit family amidase